MNERCFVGRRIVVRAVNLAFLALWIFIFLLVGRASVFGQLIADRYIVVFEPQVSNVSAAAQALAALHKVQVRFVYQDAIKGFAFAGPAQAANALSRRPAVAHVEPDQIYRTVAQTVPTGINRADVEQAIAIDGIDAALDVDIAIIDSGLDATHPDLRIDPDGVRFFESGSLPIQDGNWQDDNGHGTHVGGTAAAIDNAIGMVGCAPGARLTAVKVVDANGSGSLSAVIAGVDWVVARAARFEVANMSLGGGFSQALNDAVKRGADAGIVFVVAAGNDNGQDAATLSPASEPSALTVSAIADSDGLPGGLGAATAFGPDDSLASFSNVGSVIDVAAPGVDILSTYIGGALATASGTSMASPHVAGAAALYIARHGLAKSAAGVKAVGDAIKNAGWKTGENEYVTGDPDAFPEPLLNVARLVNKPPTANAGPDQTVTDNDGNGVETVTLNGSGSDPDGSIVAYEWRAGATVLGTAPTLAANFAVGTHTLTLTVTDNGGATGSDAAVVTVNAIPPSAGVGLVAAFGFNEGSGTVVSDSSGNANTGTISGATWTTGKFGSGLQFNGAGALVSVNDSVSLDLTTGMTLEAWVYPNSTAALWRDLIYKGADDIYYLEGSSPLGGAPAMGGTFASPLYGTSALALNSWSHLAATYDGATLRLYVNGVQVASRAQSGTIATSADALTIGGDLLYSQYWTGRIDEVRIYNRALIGSEIQSDMNTPVGGVPANQPPVASASATPTSGPAPLVVTFSSAGSSDPEGVALSYSWSFGDGSSSTQANPSHTYQAGGVYVARLTVSDGVASSSSSQINITVSTGSTPSGLVAAYAFNEGSGSTVGDGSGNGNIGIMSGASWTTGQFGSALQFNGTGALVSVNDSASLDLTTGMTLEAWVYPTSSAALWMDVIYKGRDDIYYLEGSSPLGGAPAMGGTFSSPLYGTAALPLNTWSHLAATYDRATMRLYVNGVQVASRAQSGMIATSADALTIGGDLLYSQYWAGRIDEVRIYNRALNATEIQSDMNTPVGGGSADQPPLAVASATPTSGQAPLTVAFSSAGSSDPEGQLLTYSWAFGDGTLSTEANPAHTYQATGTYLARLTVSDGLNSRSSPDITITVSGQPTNPGFVNEVVVPGINSATTIAFLPDGRMLVGELTETIWVVQPAANEPDSVPFLQIDNSHLFGEQGLMDIALDPNFAQNGYYYVFYTRGFSNQDNRDRVSRFTASGNATVGGSEFVLWQDTVACQSEHHGGSMAFGPDGKLYITVGDHFSALNAQELASYHGKILRINDDGSIPPDNPFVDGSGPNRDEIWALGLRNPFRMSIDRVTGQMYIGDVGNNDHSTAIEELNLGIRGANYGWPYCEGPCAVSGMTGPIFSYRHDGRDACITGGFVYRGSQFPSEFYGSYFFGDYVQNWIKRLTFDASGNVSSVVNFNPADGTPDGPTGDPVKLIEGPDGSLYYVDLGFNDQRVPNEGAIRRIRYVISDQPPVAVANATPTSGAAPLAVAFSSAGSFDPEGVALSYNWTFGDGTSSIEANPTHTYPASGLYSARLTVSDGVNSTLSSDLKIAVGNPPTASILSPANGSFFRAGDIISFAGSATDPEDGELPASAFSWTILFHHDGHVHPGGGPFTGAKEGTFAIPASGHDFTGNTSYEILLSVTDSSGLKSSAPVTVFPEKVNLSFETVPNGLAIELDGIGIVTPFIQDALINFQYTINAPQQTAGGTIYQFASWSDGGAQSHQIIVPASAATYVATYNATAPELPAGLVAAYGFNEGSGTAVADASGKGNNGTISGASWTTGKLGSGLQFNGAGALVTVNDSASLDLTAMTLEAWVYPNSTADLWRDVIYKGADDIYYLEGASPLGGAPAMGGTFSSPLYGTAALPLNTWSHLAATYDGATMRLYVNGVQVASRAENRPIATSTGALTIGGDALYEQYWAGRIDEVRIYNRALSASEIQSDMDREIP